MTDDIDVLQFVLNDQIGIRHVEKSYFEPDIEDLKAIHAAADAGGHGSTCTQGRVGKLLMLQAARLRQGGRPPASELLRAKTE